MGRVGKRRRISLGIYSDKGGLAAIVTVGRTSKERRFPPGTDLALIRDWRERTRAALRARRHAGRRGTLGHDAQAYLDQMRHLASFKARAVEVRTWIRVLGADTLRDAITSGDVMRARVSWLKSGTSAKTVNNRVQTLRHLFLTLDGKDERTPCDDVSPLPTAKTPPVFIDAALVAKVDAELQRRESRHELLNAKTRARFRVLATTGKRPSEIMRAQPADVDIERRVWTVRDGKGGYSPGLYLNDEMREAWQLFIAADAWGPYNTNSMARTLRSSGWPAGVRPYNLRHSTWITASERGADLADVQAGAGHRNIATTRRHYVPVLSSRMQRLSELIDRRFQWTVPSTVPSATGTTTPKPEQTRTGPHGTRSAAKRRK